MTTGKVRVTVLTSHLRRFWSSFRWGPGVSDIDFLAAFELVIVPMAKEFEPDVVRLQ